MALENKSFCSFVVQSALASWGWKERGDLRLTLSYASLPLGQRAGPGVQQKYLKVKKCNKSEATTICKRNEGERNYGPIRKKHHIKGKQIKPMNDWPIINTH